MQNLTSVAVIQFAPTDDIDANIEVVSELVRGAARAGASIALLPELFTGPYFCVSQAEDEFSRAKNWRTHPAVEELSNLAAELEIVLPVSIFEKDGPEYYNSVVMIDADGRALGIYRKSHIPDGPGYQEKYYFRPGNTGFRVWDTKAGRIGVGICWDQWFPEAARAMALLGADILLYPTAIGSEPHAPELDTCGRWQRAMQGHAVSNVIPVAAANRVGVEGEQSYYGSSFIADASGEIVKSLNRTETGIGTAQFDFAKIAEERAGWGFFRDRRPELYTNLARFEQSLED
ncbi:MAG: N-carbamoylputrescine amidase [Pseudomonadota bacterium]